MTETYVPMEQQWGIYRGRLQRFLSHEYYPEVNLMGQLVKKRWQDGIKIEVWTPPAGSQPNFESAASQEYEMTSVGAEFGPSWSTHWFRITVPEVECIHDEIYFHWHSQGEGLLWSKDGEPLHGLSPQDRSDVPYSLVYVERQPVTFYIEMACNGLFGNGSEGMIDCPDENRKYKLERCEMREYDQRVVKLYHTMQIMHDMVNTCGEGHINGRRALFAANSIINAFKINDSSSIKKCQIIADAFLEQAQGGSPMEVMAVGNCHIDTAWLWRYEETRRKTARSWSSQLSIMKKYPSFIFAASQMQQFAWLHEDYPGLFKRIVEAAENDIFLPIGGSWVEMDGNLPCGESFARQFLYGQFFQKRHFGAFSEVFWLPDTFGYNAQLPQLMMLGGMKYFVTQKLSWNNINRFPHTSFWWKGIDGTKVLTHFPPANTYTSHATSGDVIRSESDHKEVERSNCALLLYGHGDGGGGPTYEMVSRLEKMRGAFGLPKLSFTSPSKFFHVLEKESHQLLTWSGELYFELHRGTYTSQARTKFYNRRCETILKEAEMLSFVLGTVSNDLFKMYPRDELEKLWKDVLLNQFHDVLPGSSIASVYKDATKKYENVEYHASKIRDTAMNALFGNQTGEYSVNRHGREPLKDIVFFNTTPFRRDEVIMVPYDGGHDSPQSGVIAVSGIEGFSMDTFLQSQVPFNCIESVKIMCNEKKHYTMENRYLRIHLDELGHIIGMQDKENGREIIMDGERANRLMLYEDIPFYWDAWDVELHHLEKGQCVSTDIQNVQLSIGMEGPLLVSLLRVIKLSPNSSITQVISLSCLSKRVDFTCKVEWYESHQILKVDFPVAIISDNATFECPFGMVSRPTHHNTSWDVARFEVCGHRFADLSESDYGVALLNNCKYGYSVHNSCISLSLLRSPKMPDPDCDMGQHVMKFALFPHMGNVVTGGVFEEAVKFNTELLWTAASSSLYDHRWLGKSVLQFSWSNHGHGESIPITIDAIKLAEDSSDDVIIRAYEPRGCRGRARLITHELLSVTHLCQCDLLERKLLSCDQPQREEVNGDWIVSFRPFQIISLRARIQLNPDAHPSRQENSPLLSGFENIPS